ncbi:MAG TPA: putative toxin-antitoxin system toxin component, PIN family [Bacteroidetes bacterium]|nr:putative toxin-antitoxin system toxin component, PIN family [Bacteroidota bacterium]
MQKKPERLVVDTNLWISFLISGTFSKLDKVLKSGSARLIFSTELLKEFIKVVERPKFKKFISASEITSLLRDIHRYADFIEVITPVNICRDVKDNFLLALSNDGKADFLLTGDEDLLTLKKFGKTRIMLLSEYLQLYSGKSKTKT